MKLDQLIVRQLFCVSESGTGEQSPGPGKDLGERAGDVESEAGAEGAGDEDHAEQNAEPARRLREPAGRQAGLGHGDQYLSKDVGRRRAEVLTHACYMH